MKKTKYKPNMVNIDGVEYSQDYLEKMDALMSMPLESLDAPVAMGESLVSFHELLPSKTKNPYEMLLDNENELHNMLVNRANKEPKRKGRISEIKIIKMLSDGLSQSEIADKFNVSREAISKIVEKIRLWCIRLGYDPRVPSDRKKDRKKGGK